MVAIADNHFKLPPTCAQWLEAENKMPLYLRVLAAHRAEEGLSTRQKIAYYAAWTLSRPALKKTWDDYERGVIIYKSQYDPLPLQFAYERLWDRFINFLASLVIALPPIEEEYVKVEKGFTSHPVEKAIQIYSNLITLTDQLSVTELYTNQQVLRDLGDELTGHSPFSSLGLWIWNDRDLLGHLQKIKNCVKWGGVSIPLIGKQPGFMDRLSKALTWHIYSDVEKLEMKSEAQEIILPVVKAVRRKLEENPFKKEEIHSLGYKEEPSKERLDLEEKMHKQVGPLWSEMMEKLLALSPSTS